MSVQIVGNTIISFINNEQDFPKQYPLLLKAEELLEKMYFSKKLALLPPSRFVFQKPKSSFHVTLKDLLCDQRRWPADWTPKISSHLELEKVDKFVEETCLPSVDALQNKTLKLQFSRVDFSCDSIKLNLVPADEDSRKALHAFRNEISTTTGIRHGNHDDYQFHLTLAYQLRVLHQDEELVLQDVLSQIGKLMEDFGVITLLPPKLTYFEDMYEFKLSRK